MIKKLMEQNHDPIRRKFTEIAGASLAVVGLLILGYRCKWDVLIIALSIIGNAYVVARTLVKLNREDFRYPGIISSEWKAHVSLQFICLAFSLKVSADPVCLVVSINYLIFAVCRGIVKKMQGRMNLKQQVISL